MKRDSIMHERSDLLALQDKKSSMYRGYICGFLSLQSGGYHLFSCMLNPVSWCDVYRRP